MWSLFALGIVAIIQIAPSLSGVQLASRDAVSIYHSPLSRMETAYFIVSEGEYVFYFPVRIPVAGLQQVCLLILQTQSEVLCTFATPRAPFVFYGKFEGTVAVSWQMTYRNTTNDNPNDNQLYMATEEVHYNIIGIENRPQCQLRVDILSPSYAAIVSKDLTISYNIDGNYLPDSTILLSSSFVNFEVQGILTGHETPLSLNILKGQSDIEPGSWFFSLTPTANVLSNNGTSVVSYQGYPNPGLMEFVLPPEDIAKNRRYSTLWKGEKGDALQSSSSLKEHTAQNKTCPNRVSPIRVCVWGTFKMDGQKNIFLKQIQYLDRDEFKFTWVVAAFPSDGSSEGEDKQHAEVRSRLQQLSHVKVVNSPYTSVAVDLKEVDEGGVGAVPLSVQWAKNESMMYEYVSDRFKSAQGVIDVIEPKWVRKLYALMRAHMQEEGCDIVVYGNNRGFSSNMLITDTARTLGIPTVSELLNLFINFDTIPAAVVGPSVYSIEHERDVLQIDSIGSIGSNNNNNYNNNNKGSAVTINGDVDNNSNNGKRKRIISAVIPPSVDLQRFNPSIIEDSDIIHHPHCVKIRQQNPSAECYTVGFVARLSAEKNPGLFLLAAERILSVNPFVRFTVVGDGDLKQFLENLCNRLGISWAVHFTGWRSEEDLPRLLKGFDIVVNPSLRAWSETFCIANIEAMSMRVPLVTFAIGGIGEYVDDPRSHPDFPHGGENEDIPSFSISTNAIVVNIASPHAVADAVLTLIGNSTLRLSIGEAARKTVTSYFTVERQMNQYAAFYKELIAETCQ